MRCLSLAAIGALTVVWADAGPPAGAGFLARAGPTPLRFQAASPAAAPPALPPLKLADDPADTPSAETETAAPVTPAAPAPAEADTVFALVPESPAPEPPLAPANSPAPGPPPIAPQMFLRYFTGSTNQEAILAVPVEFNPPAPPPPRSSAVYKVQ